MDWNWFFSALAQSMAAIVAVISAFIVTTIIQNTKSFMEKQNSLDSLLAESERLISLFPAKYVKRVAEWTRHYEIGNSRKQIWNDHPNFKKPVEYWALGDYSLFDKKSEIVSLLQTQVRQYQQNRPADRPPGETLNPRFAEYKQIVLQARADHVHQAQLNKSFLDSNEGNPECSSAVRGATLTMVLLFGFGVIAPLLLLPSGDYLSTSNLFFGIMKTIGLLSCSLIFGAFQLYLLRQNNSLKHNKKKIGQLQKLSSLEGFSDYYKRASENERTKHEILEKMAEKGN